MMFDELFYQAWIELEWTTNDLAMQHDENDYTTVNHGPFYVEERHILRNHSAVSTKRRSARAQYHIHWDVIRSKLG